MKLKDLYSKPIERSVNPAVSATKFDEETQRIEIHEYVFTDEILNGLFRILDAIKNNKPYDHVGIWIDGYYGSGKSHFLKYLDYCITPATQEAALERLLAAVKVIDPLDASHNISFDYQQMDSIAKWLKKATIDTCIFNLETSYDNSTDKKKAFLHVFWNEFNGKRGFNKFNITLAQNLEKPLAEKGVFEEFKRRIAEEQEADWNDPLTAADMIDQEIDYVLDVATDLVPSLSKESIKERIIKRDMTMSIDRFAAELASFLKDKGDDYRLIMLADEVSQFINSERDRYLNLQEIITKLSEACENKIWIACTAQQDLSEIMDACHIVEEQDKEGKIKGRFEVKVSLKGTQPEVITQKRILEKKEEVKDDLGDLYDRTKASFDLQFKLPTTYNGYDSKEDFIAYYPFVPYQFKLIMQVFNSFLNLGYVAKEVKGNERSIIKVIHATAKANKEAELGRFISFDELYNNMFEEGLQARGQRAVNNAEQMARTYSANPQLALKVARVLFMICNIATDDQLIFPATLDNITSLLVNDVETPRLNIKNDVEKIIEYLCDKNIIRREQGKQGAPDTYQFYSEEEMKVASLIQSQQVDTNTQAEQLREIFLKYFNVRNKEQYRTRSFSVGAVIKQRSFLTSNAPDVVVDFMMDNDYDNAAMLALQNSAQNRLVFYLGPQFMSHKRLYNSFYWFCQVQRYMSTPATNADNAETRKEFEKRASEMLQTLIIPEFQKILDTCPVVSGLSEIDESELSGKRGAERYSLALQKHLASIYKFASFVDSPQIPRNSEALRKAILRPIQPGDYDGMNTELLDAEKHVENYLNKQFGETNVADVTAKFQKAPYGWDSICTLHIINELVRRHRRDYSYANNPNVDPAMVASRIMVETNKFTLRAAVAIPQEILNQFAEVWKEIFGTGAGLSTSDSSQMFRTCREIENDYGLEKLIRNYNKKANEYAQYPFVTPLRNAVELFEKWMMERDPQKFFNLVIADKEMAKTAIDICKEVLAFINDQLDNYKGVIKFVSENHDNFDYIPEELKEQVASIKEIETLQWPIRVREYMRMKNILTGAIDQVKTEIREQIKKAYQLTYDQLVQACEAEGVPTAILSDINVIIATKTASNSIPALKNNVNTDAFFGEQAGRIQRKKIEMQPKPVVTPDNPDKPAAQPAPKEKTVTVQLRTRTITPLKSENEVDKYLADLKDQLMKQIKDGNSVMVIR